MDRHRVPGAAVARVEEGALAWTSIHGVMNIETGEPVKDRSLFQAASLSKPIFAYVVMQAIDRGVLSLDERLVETSRPPGLSDNPWVEEITVRDALQHTSGLPNWRSAEENAQLVPAFQPGTDSIYSGEAYVWLQRVLEQKLDKGLDSIMRESLFEPAGLGDMSMLWEADRDAREVYGHVVDDEGVISLQALQFQREIGVRYHEVAEEWGLPLRQWRVTDFERAMPLLRAHTHERLINVEPWRLRQPVGYLMKSPSGLRSTAGDFARFVALMMQSPPPGDWAVTEQTRQLMLTPQFERPTVQNGVLPRGLGWGLETRDTGVAFYHWGSNFNTHRSVALGDPSDGSGIVVMANSSTAQDFIRDVVAHVTGRNYIGVST